MRTSRSVSIGKIEFKKTKYLFAVKIADTMWLSATTSGRNAKTDTSAQSPINTKLSSSVVIISYPIKLKLRKRWNTQKPVLIHRITERIVRSVDDHGSACHAGSPDEKSNVDPVRVEVVDVGDRFPRA